MMETLLDLAPISVVVGCAYLAYWLIDRLHERYCRRIQRRQWRRLQVFVLYDEPWHYELGKVTVSVRRPVTSETMNELRRRLQQRRQSAKLPAILGVLELDD